jgi:hypothetical protein
MTKKMQRRKASDPEITKLLKKANRLAPVEVVTDDDIIMGCTDLIRAGDVAPLKGKFMRLYETTQEVLQDEFDAQAELAQASIRVAQKTTELMTASLQAQLAELQKQTDRNKE